MKYIATFSVLSLFSSSLFADCFNASDTYPNAVIPVSIEKQAKASTNSHYANSITGYKVSLGNNNQMFKTCFAEGESTLLFVFNDNTKGYDFESIEFFFADELERTQVPQYEVGKDFVRVVLNGSFDSAFKYNLIFRDKSNNVRITYDPVIVVKKNPPATSP